MHSKSRPDPLRAHPLSAARARWRVQAAVLPSAFLAAACLQLGAREAQAAETMRPGLFDDIAEQPISAEAVLHRWTRRTVEDFCRRPAMLSDPQMSPEACARYVDEAAPRCAEEALPTLPATVADKELARQAGRTYVRCLLP